VLSSLLIGTTLAQYDVTGTVVDATKSGSDSFIPNASVTFRYSGTTVPYNANTGVSGVYSVTNLTAGNYEVSVSASGFYNFTGQLYVNQTILNHQGADFALSPSLPSGYRFVLTWASLPLDMDAHFYTPWGCEVFFQNRACSNETTFAVLDRDEQSGYGPETITLNRTTNTQPLFCGTYEIWVNIFDNTANFGNSKAIVSTYEQNQGLKSIQAAPAVFNLNEKWWRVMRLNVDSTGNVEFINYNTAHSAPPSYPFDDAVTCDGASNVVGLLTLCALLLALLL
jgi:hypothetical protein